MHSTYIHMHAHTHTHTQTDRQTVYLWVLLFLAVALRQRTIPLFYDMMVLLSRGKDGFRLVSMSTHWHTCLTFDSRTEAV